MRQCAVVCLLSFSAFFVPAAIAGDFVPDPATVQRDGPAYRYPQAGWIVLHVEGEPYERGEQQGTLLWREIQNYIKCFAMQKSSSAPEEAWRVMRTMTDALFVRHFDPELLQEMKGIADGAAAAGAKFDGRPVDLTDIVAINVWPEFMTLDYALHAEPTGLEGKVFSTPSSGGGDGAAQVSRCSAFAATGPATRDGKAIIGHITMYDLYPCDFFNVWIDVKPSSGHRVMFQAAPGSVQSGMDWYMNDAGMVLTETTVRQTRFDPNGLSIGSRSRRAMQYGDSIDTVTGILGGGGNGLYTNEWLLADMKTNEIALFELGTKASYLLRSSKNQWFGGTTGFYWGNNNTKDLAVRMETIATTNDRPEDMTFCPEARDIRWIRLYEANKGTIDADFARRAFGQPPLATGASCDCKFTTADMALQMKSVAHWGDPYGQLWEAAPDEQAKFPDEKPIVPGDWTVMTPAPPVLVGGAATTAVDLKNSSGDESSGADSSANGAEPPEPEPVWHGTILPASDGDIWLASAFARYHGFMAREKQMFTQHEQEKARDVDASKDKDKSEDPNKSGGDLTQDEKDELAVDLFGFRADARSIGMGASATPLRQIKFDPADDVWHISASGRGAMLLSELRRRMGTDKFVAAMDAFGRAHAGAAASSDSFIAAMNAASRIDLRDFFSRWLDGTDALPTLELSDVSMAQKDSGYVVGGRVTSQGGCTPASVDVTVETGDDETTQTVAFVAGVAAFHITSDDKPTRVVVNKYGQTPCTNGWDWPVSAFRRDLKHTIIIYGTDVDEVGNHIAAEKLREGMIQQWEHEVLPIMPDTLASDDVLRGHHVVLIGRPACSELIARLTSGLPVKFGADSFVVRGQLYANSDSAVIEAGSNPLDGRYSVVCIAGLSPGATLSAAKILPDGGDSPVKLMAANSDAKDIVPPAEELGHGFEGR